MGLMVTDVLAHTREEWEYTMNEACDALIALGVDTTTSAPSVVCSLFSPLFSRGS